MSSAVTSAQQNAGAQQSKNKLLCKLMAQKKTQTTPTTTKKLKFPQCVKAFRFIFLGNFLGLVFP